jgi:hypothetical protein
MNKTKWALLILSGLLVFGYIKLFYKTYSETAVAKTADCIIALDVKRITNTIIWNFITTPGQWKTPSVSKSGKGEVSWKDMVEIPDYVFAFHVKNQPVNAWHTVLQVKNENDFAKGLQQYHFEKINAGEYVGKENGIRIFKKENKILISNAAAETNYAAQVANEIFTQKSYAAKETLTKVIAAKSHLAIYIAPNSFLQQDGMVTANFDNQKIEISSALTPHVQYIFAENNFSFPDSSLCALGFTQPSAAVYALLTDSSKNNISKALSINIDSLFLQSNKYYSLNLAAIQPRIDSAITYEYDDNFNKVQKVVVNNVEEPAFNFTIAGDSVTNIYNYWGRTGTVNQTDTGELFTAMPFVKSYCHLKTQKELNITAANYQNTATDKKSNCILFLNMLFTKIPASLLKYLPGNMQNAIANMELLQLVAQKNNSQVILHCNFYKKKNDLPIVKL